MFSPDRICASIGAVTAREAVRQFRWAVGPQGRARVVELRLDYLAGPSEQAKLFRWLSRQRRLPAIIATCRTHRGGGRFAGTAQEELAVLAQAVRAGCGWCDVDVRTASRVKPADLRRALAPARVLISAHDFKRVPAHLEDWLKRLVRCGGHAVKIAAACRNLADARRLLVLARGRRNLVLVPMGEPVLAARILALREGSALTYASVAEATGPGQLSLDALRRVYRLGPGQRRAAKPLTRRTRVYGVIGDPIGHSLSPLMHNTRVCSAGIDAILLPFHVRDLRDFLDSVGPAGYCRLQRHDAAQGDASCGIWTTAIRWRQRSARSTPSSCAAGASTGTIQITSACCAAIERRVPLACSRVLLFGAGGAARAAAFALAQAGAVVVDVRAAPGAGASAGARRRAAQWSTARALRARILRRHRELHARRHAPGRRLAARRPAN